MAQVGAKLGFWGGCCVVLVVGFGSRTMRAGLGGLGGGTAGGPGWLWRGFGGWWALLQAAESEVMGIRGSSAFRGWNSVGPCALETQITLKCLECLAVCKYWELAFHEE